MSEKTKTQHVLNEAELLAGGGCGLVLKLARQATGTDFDAMATCADFDWEQMRDDMYDSILCQMELGCPAHAALCR